jgi:hypothetical protein
VKRPENLILYVNKLEARIKELEAQDDPILDATDFAHPAWWRGSDYSYFKICETINRILDGKDKGEGAFGGKELEDVRRKILELMSKT